MNSHIFSEPKVSPTQDIPFINIKKNKTRGFAFEEL